VQRGDDATGPVAEGAQLGTGGGRRSGVVLREGRRGGENPGGDSVQQELTWAVPVSGHDDIRYRDLRAQVEAGGGLAGGRGQVQPADLVRRVRAQPQLARGHLAVPADLVADPPVICRGEGERAEGPLSHDEPRAARRLHVGHNKHLTADAAVPDRDHLPRRHDPPRCPPGCRLGASRAGAAGREPVPCSDGKADAGLDLIRNVGADSAHGSQRLRDQCEADRIPPVGNAARRHLHHAT
jgi:hypothetical protein